MSTFRRSAIGMGDHGGLRDIMAIWFHACAISNCSKLLGKRPVMFHLESVVAALYGLHDVVDAILKAY
jgi:hypothetical protein